MKNSLAGVIFKEKKNCNNFEAAWKMGNYKKAYYQKVLVVLLCWNQTYVLISKYNKTIDKDIREKY